VGTHTILGYVGGSSNNGYIYGKNSTTIILDSLNSVTYEMKVGWNMVSCPFASPTIDKDSLFPNNASYAFSFDWGYKPTDKLRYDTGYWLKLTENRTITITGHPLLVDTIDVTPGWHMIGSLSVPILRTSITSLPPGIVNQVIGFPHCYSVEGGWFTCDQDLYIRPGQSYWVKILSPGKIILDGRQ
jgi:hypothetical protein